jgi:putative hydrolase of the HAD superfamily
MGLEQSGLSIVCHFFLKGYTIVNKPVVRAIFFDIDDTLYPTTEFTRQAYQNSIEAMVNLGLKMSPSALLQELQEVLAEFTSNYPFHFDKLLLRIPQETYHGINRAILVASAVAAYHDTKHSLLKPYPDALQILQNLSGRNLIRGVITAGLEVKQAEKLVRLNVYSYLTPDAIFISDQIGISKPNPKIYQYVCNTLQLKPEEIVYIGDNPDSDIDPANQVGMITVRIRREGKYYHVEGKTKPRYQVSHFDELLPLLEENLTLCNYFQR